ncbi:Integral membrane protein [Streptomyces ambofaciens ATCC 23877]|uniref:Integral membrane protein n=1 Tax=Streptomyces ambofaciens (strain ATCC 23877 / 3486 / DSM 40053 / JCM 4204 / NBRC 12836 / NRRL B-2516) TaxID=278992 RepID=A0A0K2AS69_STRA7|nr:glycosyltransferase family 39 protein [Streptomyces ambofaciens]AKZ55849.1 Integral membrane protein [Streptomyces ambofaciens ATCC 23877]
MTSATAPLQAAPEPPPAPTPAPGTPRWSLPALLAILALAAGLYSWNLSGTGLNSFYSAAVLSGTESWKAWFFGSLDAGNFLTVDKPPFALMVMGLSCRLLGYGTWQMMLPLILAALATIWILHSSVKRVWGHGAAAVAALVLALTPITVAINRDNNPDTLLVFLMVGGAALGLRAVRDGRLLPLLGAAACFGLAFHTKMLQGYIALPAVFVAYLYATDLGWTKRIRNLLLAAVVLAVSSFWWAVAVSLVPASERPYIGGSEDGTAWNLITGYNGLGRIFGGNGNMGGGGGGGGGGFSGAAGIGRMFNDVLGGQISWLLPFAGIALAGGLALRGRAPRTDLTRAALVLWGGWTVLHYLTFAMAEGTMHPYYTTALAPGIAALCGGGGVMLLRAFRTAPRWAWVLPLALGVTGVWAVVLLRRAAGWNTWLWPTIAVVMALAIAGLLVFRSGRRVRLLAVSVAAAVVAGVAGPAAYAWSVPSGSGGGMGGTNPTAGPSTGGGMGGPGGADGRGGFPGGGEGGPGTAGPGGEQPTGEGTGGQQQAGPGGGSFPGDGEENQTPGGATGSAPNGTQPGNGTAANGDTGATDGTGTAPDDDTGTETGDGTGRDAGVSGGIGADGQPGSADRFGGGGGMGGASTELVAYLKKHQDGAKWLLAVSGSQSAAQLILSSGEPVISMWGWSGSDNAMTLVRLKELVGKGELRYVQVGGQGMGGGRGGGSGTSSEVTDWVREHGTAVEASEYGATSSAEDTSGVYRLDPSDLS